MQPVYRFSLRLLCVTLSPARAQLLYTDPARDDGPCTYPSPMPLLDSNLLIYNPLATYYVPVASENFYRYEYQMATNQPAETEDEITSLQTRAQLIQVTDLLTQLAEIKVYFFNDTAVNYVYSGLPALSINPVFDLKATAVHGSSGTGPSGFGGEITFTVIWNDNSPAWNVWTCVGGRQMFHIISGAPSLTEEQLEINTKLLTDLGFNTTNFQYLQYSN